MEINLDKAKDIFKSCSHVMCDGSVYYCRLSVDEKTLRLYSSRNSTFKRCAVRLDSLQDVGCHWIMKGYNYTHRIKPINLTYVIPTHEPQ